MKGLPLRLCLISLLATPAWGQTAADIIGPAQPLDNTGSFNGTLLEDNSEVLTPVGIMDETTFSQLAPQLDPQLDPAAIQPAAGPQAILSPTELQPSATLPQPLSPTTALSPTTT